MSYSICPRCDRKMAPGTSCDESPWRQDGKVIAPVRSGDERSPGDLDVCRPCNAPRGGTHHVACSWEECPHGNQAITCDDCPIVEDAPYFRAVA